MENRHNTFQTRSLAVIFGLIIISLIGMLALHLFKPKPKTNIQSKVLDYPVSSVWNAVYEKAYYLRSKKEIMKYSIYDSVKPNWTEYYSPNDSVQNKTTAYHVKKSMNYTIVNLKYEQLHNISIALDSISSTQTKVTIAEKSIYNNAWAGIYFQMLHPHTVLDYEFVKISNTLQYIDSVSRK